MDKTYKIIHHEEALEVSEIRRLYTGYWVYIVNAKIGPRGELISGIPVVIGAMAADGAEDGIYEKYKSAEYGTRTDLNLLTNRGFISSLKGAGDRVEQLANV